MIKAIGIETQIENLFFGETEDVKNQVINKIEFIKNNSENIFMINNKKVYNVSIKEDEIWYNLKNNNKYPQRYYYPIKYADIKLK